MCAALRARGARRLSVGAPAAANGFLELVRCYSSRVCVCVSPWWPPPNCAPTAVLRLRGPRVGRPRVIDVDLARRRRRPRPPARRTAGHAAGGREVCDPRGAHGASGQRCVRAHGLRCRCGCGAVRESVGRVRVWSVGCVALVWLLLCRAQAGVDRPMQGVVAPVAQRCLQRRSRRWWRWRRRRRRRPRSWKLGCQCRPRAHALAAQTPQLSRPATVGAFALATGHVSADQLATSLTRIFTADADMTGDWPPCP